MFGINKDVELLWRYENMKTNRKLFEKIVKTATDADAKVAMCNVNSACSFMLHQPKIPVIPNRFQT